MNNHTVKEAQTCQRVGDLDLVNSTQRSFLTENKDWYAVCYSMTTPHREIVTVVQGMNEVHGNFYAHAQELHRNYEQLHDAQLSCIEHSLLPRRGLCVEAVTVAVSLRN